MEKYDKQKEIKGEEKIGRKRQRNNTAKRDTSIKKKRSKFREENEKRRGNRRRKGQGRTVASGIHLGKGPESEGDAKERAAEYHVSFERRHGNVLLEPSGVGIEQRVEIVDGVPQLLVCVRRRQFKFDDQARSRRRRVVKKVSKKTQKKIQEHTLSVRFPH